MKHTTHRLPGVDRFRGRSSRAAFFATPSTLALGTLIGMGVASVGLVGGCDDADPSPQTQGMGSDEGGSGRFDDGVGGSGALGDGVGGIGDLGDGGAPGGVPETCTDDGDIAVDENRNGEVDEGCSCELGATQQCCTTGIQTCDDNGGEFGLSWGTCVGGTMEPEICGDGIDQDCDGVDEECPDVESSCEQNDHQTAHFDVEFPGNTSVPCPWNVADNNDYQNGRYAARIEHVNSIDLPPGAIICSMDFNIPQTSMYFDDTFLLAFDEAVLIGDVQVSYFDTAQGLYLYDWSKIRGQPVNAAAYCLGGGPCQLPATETAGVMALSISQSWAYVLSQRALAEGRTDFLVVSTGDDNPGSDCHYSPFTLEVDVEYVIP